ncbi:hypothetical protein M3Y94_00336000 [Aphelenchoides besseyi]|nr:hypothetical protein M3Y94_00336000 [Aphelenchoides besseyi]KAI6235504.1 hypothetical protein M3Y95_00058600 [Aphelenchoides besseyi]
MKIFDWLCWCDSPHRDESTQYITTDGAYAKKPVLCTEQPKSHKEEVRLSGKKNGVVTTQYPKQNVTSTNGTTKINTNETSTPILKEVEVIGVIKPAESDSFSVPDFPSDESTVRGYRELAARVKGIMNDKQTKLENLLNRNLPNDVDEDVRSARGKIIVIGKNNLSTFEKLLADASDEPQQIQDLTGFWGLVHKELLDVQRTCQRVEELRLNNWKSLPREATPPPTVVQNRAKTTPAKPGPQTPSRTPKANPNLRAFMDQRRKEMKSNENLTSKVELMGQ